ncbi:MAG TPA: hypothetical protein VNZ53_33215 [Steroidobacteraceae bacterium]|nr:hypothetical protein [Steroidobacteraceae bacterium]
MVALLASSGRPLTQITTELGIQPTMLRNWRDRSGGRNVGPALRPTTRASARIPFRTRRPRSFGFAARTIGCAWSVTFKKLWPSSRSPRNEVPPI